MIVKRMVESLRRQDWTMVAIEFVLVVVGVLMAFQISEWAAEREARKEREAATMRLLGEAEDNVAYMNLGVDAQKQLTSDLEFAIDRVQSGRWLPSEESRMRAGLARALFVAPPAPPSSVYDDLVSSGEFGKIGDADLRSTIAKYHATLGIHARAVDYFSQKLPNLERHQSLRYSFRRGDAAPLTLDVDFPALARETAALEDLAILAAGQRQVLILRQRTLKGAERMCQELGRVVGKPCNLKKPPPTFD